MNERLLIVASLALVVTLGVIAARALAWRRATQRDSARLWSALGTQPDGRPAVVVFSTPGCVACRTAQQPAVEALIRHMGNRVRTLHIDIATRPAAARAFSVLTAPSTAVLEADGSLRALNHGFASTDRLAAQVSAAGGPPASAGSARRPAPPARSEPAPAVRR